MAFPADPLDVLVELSIGGQWTDITEDVYLRDLITIGRGRADEGSRVGPGSCTLTINNRHGKYSARNPLSPYFGKIGRNTPIRVSVPAAGTALYLPGTTGNATTPDHASLDIVGDLDVRVEATVEEWGNTSAGLVSKWLDGGQLSWTLWLNENGTLTLFWSTTGVNVLAATSTVRVPAELRHQALRATLDVNNGSGGWTCTFYTAATIGGSWTQLGAAVTGAGVTSIFSSTAPLQVGELLGAEVRSHVQAAEVRSGINGALVAAPVFSAQPPGATSFTDSAGRVWSLTGDAAITDRAYRFHGEVSSWPPRWDVSGEDKYVPIVAAGILRRLGQGKKPISTALRRSIGGASPAYSAWWPLEDAAEATQAAPGYPRLAPMRMVGEVNFGQELTGAIGTGISVGETGRLFGAVPSTGMTEWTIAVWLDLPADMGANGLSPVLQWRTPGSPGSVAWSIYTGTAINGRLLLESGQVGGGIVISAGGNTDLRGRGPVQVLVSGAQVGADVVATVKVDGVNDFSAASAGDTIAPITAAGINMSTSSAGFDQAGIVTHLIVAPRSRENAILGHVAAGRGYTAEQTATRISRLAREEGITVGLIGTASDTALLGPQRPRPVLDLLEESGDADGGTLHEQRDWPALRYRSRASDYNRVPLLTLDFLTNLAAPFEPDDDDQTVRNDMTISREGGSSAQVVREDGPLSIQPPPAGVGKYDEALTLNLADDSVLRDHAGWRVHLGTWDELRYPVVGVWLHRDPDLIEPATAVDIRSPIRVTGLPAGMPPGDVDLLVDGYTEVLGMHEWTIAYNTVPAGPWTIGVLDDPLLGRLDTGGSHLAATVDTDDTTLLVSTTAGGYWSADPADVPFDIQIGGEKCTVTGVADGVVDGFARTVASGWGSTPEGLAWTTFGSSAATSVSSDAGRIAISARDAAGFAHLPSGWESQDIEIAFTSPAATITGDHLYVLLMACVSPTISNYYTCRAVLRTTGTISLQIERRDPAITVLAADMVIPGLTVGAGTTYRMRLAVQDGWVSAKVWSAPSAEPDWQMRAYDTTYAAGMAGLHCYVPAANTNAFPVTFQITEVRLHNPQRLTVTRSVNGIAKAHLTDADVRLAHPTIVAL
ncbi:hypothetical protein ACGFNU_24380 [Spirillospora sp. NPDC048911]|uniref:hypothetical protein n=1 Tax=Spirillospora sp. NPDC048911 TaxID=3364527 RepID=UPI003719958E